MEHFTEVGGSHFDPDHGHEHVGDHHMIAKPKKEEKKGLKFQFNLFSNGQISREAKEEDEVKDKYDHMTEEELMMYAGDGLFGGYIPEKYKRHIPKRIEELQGEIDTF